MPRRDGLPKPSTLRSSLRPRARTGLLAVAAALALGACGGGGGGDTPVGPPGGGGIAPGSLSYPASSYLLSVGVPFAGPLPSAIGSELQYTVEPPLPAGVTIDALTGRITGTPLARGERAIYRVRASNALGSAAFDLDLAVAGTPRFAYSANAGDSTLSIYLVDAQDGALQPLGYHAQDPADVEPEHLVVHPSGAFLFTANATSQTLATHHLDPQTGRVTASESRPIGAGPHALALSGDGRWLYVLERGAGSVSGFSVGADGALAPIPGAGAVGGDAFELLIDPLGRYLAVLHIAGGVRTFPVDPTSGALAAGSDMPITGGTLAGGALSPAGTSVYVTVQGSDEVRQFAADPLTATLQPVGQVAGSAQPGALTVHPAGGYAYLLDSVSGVLTRYGVDALDGALSLLPGNDAAPAGVDSLVFSEDGAFGWALDRSGMELALLSFDPATGALDEMERTRTRNTPAAFGAASGDQGAEMRTARIYVSNRDSDDVSTFGFDDATGLVEELDLDAAGDGPSDVGLDPWGRFALVCSSLSGTLHAFAIEADGQLAPLGAPLLVGGEPSALAVDPSGRFVFVADRLGNRVVQVSLAEDGALALLGSTPVGTFPVDVECSPNGDFLYVANRDGGGVSQFAVDPQTGSLTSKVPAFANSKPTKMEFTRGGDRAYMSLSAGNLIVPYEADPQTGELAFVPPGTRALTLPVDVDVSASGRYAYTAMLSPLSEGGVLVFDIREADGWLWNEDTQGLTWTGWALAGQNPIALESDPAEQFLFVISQGSHSLSVLSIDGATGQLTSVQDKLVGLFPTALALATRIE